MKIGGRAAERGESVADLGADMRRLGAAHTFVLVHGGGAELTRISRLLGYEPNFRDGVRMTSPREMDLVDMVLSGKVNAWFVRTLQMCDLNAVGLTVRDPALTVVL